MIKYIHGSEDSLDVDVLYVFNEMPSFKECQNFCSDKKENRNIIIVNNGKVENCFKGTPDEINNGLIETYSLHSQKYENILKSKVERDILIKLIRVVRCLLSHCSRTVYRDEVKESLRSSNWIKKINTLKLIQFDQIEDFGKAGSKEDVYKIFAFQLGQALGLLSGKEFYTKSSISREYEKLRKYLYREKDTDPEDLVYFINLFIEKILELKHEEENGITYFNDFSKKIDLKKEKYI